MANKTRMIELVLNGRLSSGFSPAFQKAQKNINKYQRMLTGVASSERAAGAARQSSMGSLLRSAAGYAAAYVGTQQLAQGIWGCVKEYDGQIKAENRLFQLMSNVKGVTRAQIVAMKTYAGQLQNLTTVGDDVNLMGASQLSTFQLQAASIRKLLPSLQDLAVGTHGINVNQQQMQQSANLLGKVFTGQVSALRRVGITFSKTQEHILKTGTESEKTAMLVKVISQNYGGLAKRMAATPEGRILQLANAWGDVKETIGGALSPYVLNAIAYISKNLPSIQAVLGKITSAGKQLISVLAPVAVFIYNIGQWVVTNWSKVGPIIMGIVGAITAWKIATALMTAAQTALNFAMSVNPVGLIIAAIGALIGLIYLLIKHWDTVRAAIGRAWAAFLNFFADGPGRLIPILNLIGVLARNWGTVKGALVAVWEWAKKVYDWFGKIFDKAGKLIAKVAGSKIGRAALTAAGAGALIPGRASGGPVSAGQPYVVGERGPELFVPRRSGGIVPNGQLAAAGVGGITFSPTINISGSASRADIDGALQMSERRLEAMIERIMANRARRSFA